MRVKELKAKILQGKADADAIEQEFTRLAGDLAKLYTDSFAAVDAAEDLSETARKTIKMDILTLNHELPEPELYRKGLAAGNCVDATSLKAALDSWQPMEALVGILTGLGIQINNALQVQYGEEEWRKLTARHPTECMMTRGAAFMAMADKVPGLMEALAGRDDINIYAEQDKIQFDPQKSLAEKEGIIPAYAGLPLLQQAAEFNGSFSSLEAQTPILQTIKNADIPQDLKARWSGKALSGEITSPAMARALIENVPDLPAETHPIMERFILMQPYAPVDAVASAEEARTFALEIAGWRNFSTVSDPGMAPVENLIKVDIAGAASGNQEYDRGISNQMKPDVHRSVYVINGEELRHSDAEEVSRSLRRAMPSENAAKLVSSIVSQRSFEFLRELGKQVYPANGEPLPPEVKTSMVKMATRDFLTGGLLHIDLAIRNQSNTEYTVTVRNGKATIVASETVGLASGLPNDAQGNARLCGKARYTLQFECDLLGPDGKSPRIETVHLSQQLLPAE